MMNLLYYNSYLKEKTVCFNNIELKAFLRIFPSEKYISINNLFAHSPVKEYNELDFPKNLAIVDLNKFKDDHKSVLIDTINFSVDSVQVNVSDEYNYRITSEEPYFSIFVDKVFKLIQIADDIWEEVQKNADKYILVENCKIICIFSSFDEYLQSDYSSML